jgi:MOSC domain-containing protein YiiM
MRVISVNVGSPREVVWRGRAVRTGIWKSPVQGPRRIRSLNLDGDGQADLSVHGGPDKAVYLYPSEHYAAWRRELPDAELGWGAFGENLTAEGLLEDRVCIGDRLRVGDAELIVTQPRMPCFKLGIRFGRPEMVKRFLERRRPGFYLRVLTEGDVRAGDAIEAIGPPGSDVTVAEVVELYVGDASDPERLRRAAELPALPGGWKEHFRERLRADAHAPGAS